MMRLLHCCCYRLVVVGFDADDKEEFMHPGATMVPKGYNTLLWYLSRRSELKNPFPAICAYSDLVNTPVGVKLRGHPKRCSHVVGVT